MAHPAFCTVEYAHSDDECRMYEQEQTPIPTRTAKGYPILAFCPTGRPSMVVSENVVLCQLPEHHPQRYVTWMMRGSDGLTFEGHYCSTLREALQDFVKRCEWEVR